MLLRFYLFALVPTLIFLILGLVKQQRELALRCFTLIVLLHFICLALWQGYFGLFMGVVFVLGLYELASQYRINQALLIAPGLLILAYLHPHVLPAPVLLLFYILAVVLVFRAPVAWVRHPFFCVLFAASVLLPSTHVLIRLSDIHTGHIITILWLLQLNDIFGLLFGKKFGKTHPFPNISPGKSIEGYVAGGIGIGIGIALLHTWIPVLSPRPLLRAALLFLLFFVLGNMGDLLFSSLKRKLGIKDFSRLLPGHGGILDRFDNILFVALPVHLLVQFGIFG